MISRDLDGAKTSSIEIGIVHFRSQKKASKSVPWQEFQPQFPSAPTNSVWITDLPKKKEKKNTMYEAIAFRIKSII